jgi:folate-binding protein YgfZ
LGLRTHLTNTGACHNRFVIMATTDSPDLNTALLVRHTRSGLLHITGEERRKWLQGIITADVINLSDNAFWGLLLQRTGKLRGEVIGIVEETGIWLAVLGGELTAIYKYLDSLVVMEDVNISIDPSRALWALHRANDGAPAMPSHLPSAVARGSLNWIGDADRVYVVSDSVESEWLAAFRASGIEPSSDETWEQYRIRSGLPKWDVDYSSQDTPHHAGLFGRAVTPNKGCYIGQEVVCKVEMLGHVSQRLTRIELASPSGITAGLGVQDKLT